MSGPSIPCSAPWPASPIRANLDENEQDATQSELSDQRLRCITHAALFSGLTSSQLQEIASLAEDCFYREGDIVFLQDDPVRRVLLVASGSVKITRVTEAGDEILLRLEHPGDWLNASSCSSHIHSVCAYTKGPSLLLAWETASFEALSTRIPVIERNMVRIVRKQLEALQTRFCDVSVLPVSQRLARLIYELGFVSSDSLSLSREELAQMCGTTMFTVSRLLSSWAESEIVTLDRRKILIADEARLHGLAQAV